MHLLATTTITIGSCEGASQDVVDQIVRFQGSAWIPRQIYFNLTGTYRFDLPPTALARSIGVLCRIRNALDHDAPVLAARDGMAYTSET